MNTPNNTPKRTEPTVSLLKGHRYVPADKTDIRQLFERIRAEQLASKQIKFAVAVDFR